MKWTIYLMTVFCTLESLAASPTTSNDYYDEELEFVLLNNPSPCQRQCGDSEPMICHYKFVVEWYYAMSKACYECPYNITDCSRLDCIPADGVNRAIVTVNRRLPGTPIEVCKGDLIIVDIENELLDESTSIHWHGLHQKGTPYMDGVPSVTQCGILPKNSFRYEFRANEVGTHFWHSHSGFQRGDGAFGALTIRIPQYEDPHGELYDFDLFQHSMLILDWEHQNGVERFQAHHHSLGDNKPPGMLINGKGRYKNFGENSEELYTPLEVFTVRQGYRYRFRLVNAGYLNCPIEMSIDNHTMLVISTDGKDIEPVEVTSLVSYAGERFDFVIDANETIANYWIRYKGLMDCDERFSKAFQVAILQYDGAPEDEEPEGDADSYEIMHNHGVQLNALNVPHNLTNTIDIANLQALDEDDIALKEIPDRKFYLAFDFYSKDNPHFHKENVYGFHQIKPGELRVNTPQINHISMKLPPMALLPMRDYLKPEMFCNESTVSNCENKFCECTHVLQVPLNSVVELVLIDEGFTYNANHPLHLHGHYFRVVAMDRLGNHTTIEQVKEHDRMGLIKRKLTNAAYKDTVTVPDGGYTVVRFHANNPGYWLFHCHIEWHVEVGMALVFKVGEDSDMPPVPKHFPACYNYMPYKTTTTTTSPTNETNTEVVTPHNISSSGWWDISISSSSTLAINYLLILSLTIFLSI